MVDVDEWVAVRGDALLRLAYVLSGNRVDAEDAVREALSRALPRWSEIVETDDPEAYVRRAVVDAHLSRWRGFRTRESPVAEVRLGDMSDPDAVRQDRVWRACLGLPPEQRVAVVLRYFEHRDDEEIADLTGVREGTVRSQVSLGLAGLRTELEDDEADLETRLAEALAGTAERLPAADDLAAGARARLRRRRRTTAAVLAACCAVVAVPVGVAALVLGPGSDGADGTGLPPGWRTETWRDLSVDVPDWVNQGPWCAHGDEPGPGAPGVTHPLPDEQVTCVPAYGYGVHFSAPSGGELPPGTEGTVQQYQGDQRYPDGAWIAYVSTRHAAVWVVTNDPALTRRVLDTAEPVGDVDVNGCPTRVERTPPSDRDRLSVCRYDHHGWLVQSELLSHPDSVAAGAALEDAPSVMVADSTCAAAYPPRPFVTMRAAGVSARLFAGRGCGVASIFSDGSGTGALVTGEILHWALSPGSEGSLPGVAPDRMRTD